MGAEDIIYLNSFCVLNKIVSSNRTLADIFTYIKP